MLSEILAHMRQQPRLHAVAVKRSLANSRGSREEQLVGRMGLANALGESGDIAGEETQLRAVLKLAPGHVHARFALGNLLMQKQRHDDAIVELMMAMQLPNDDPPLPEPHVQQVRGAARGQLCNCLGSGSQRARCTLAAVAGRVLIRGVARQGKCRRMVPGEQHGGLWVLGQQRPQRPPRMQR